MNQLGINELNIVVALLAICIILEVVLILLVRQRQDIETNLIWQRLKYLDKKMYDRDKLFGIESYPKDAQGSIASV